MAVGPGRATQKTWLLLTIFKLRSFCISGVFALLFSFEAGAHVAWAGLQLTAAEEFELLILLSLSLKCWDSRLAWLFPQLKENGSICLAFGVNAIQMTNSLGRKNPLF